MRKTVLKASTALAAIAVAASGALAADLPSRAPAPFVAVPVFTWTGFYLGVNAGAGFDIGREIGGNSVAVAKNSIIGSEGSSGTINFANGPGSRNDVGFIGGGQVGYNYQFGAGSGFVVGLEADIQYADLGERDSNLGTSQGYTFVPTAPTAASPVNLGLAFAPPRAAVFRNDSLRGVDWFGTVRGRIGYAFDRVLVFATGGLAYGGGGSDDEFGFRNAAFNGQRPDSVRLGYAAGGGFEYALASGFTIKAEAMYVSLESGNRNGVAGPIGLFNPIANTVTLVPGREPETEFVVGRLGINYKF